MGDDSSFSLAALGISQLIIYLSRTFNTKRAGRLVKKNNCHLFLLSSLGFRTQRVSTGPYYAHAVRLSACHWGYILADVKGSQGEIFTDYVLLWHAYAYADIAIKMQKTKPYSESP